MAMTLRQRVLKRHAALKKERSSWRGHWEDMALYIQPRRGRFLVSDANRGGKKNDKIINATPFFAARILASGMMAGITSPARKWFRLTIPDPEVAKAGAVRSWLNLVEERMFEVFSRSNIYSALTTVYEDLGTPGTAALYIEEDMEDVIRAYVFPIGSYCLANNARLRADTIYRETAMTVGQLAEKFGVAKCSKRVQDLHKEDQLDEWIQILHVIEPNPNHKSERMDAKAKKYRSLWLDLDGAEEPGKDILYQGGYDDFPVMCPRWNVTGEDVYGSSPGMDALGDAKGLQQLEREKLKAAQKLVSPPMKAPSSLMGMKVNLVPGDVTFVDEVSGGERFSPAHEVDPRALPELRQAIAEHERRINQAYSADLMLMISNTERSNITAEEIRAKQQEKMLQLGPVLERLNDELLDPLIDRVFNIMVRMGLIPPSPEQLAEMEMKVEYTSILSQAQKMLGTTAQERFVTFVVELAKSTGQAELLDNVNFDKVVAEYAVMTGVSPDQINSEETKEQIRAARAQAAQAQAQGAAMLAATEGARNLASANLENDNALARMTGALGPAAAAVAPGGAP